MDESSVDRLIAATAGHRQHDDALWSIALVTDAQAVSADSTTVSGVLQQVERLRRQEAGQVVLESCLPEIRCLAMLLAAQRHAWSQAGSPNHFADEADWLGARIHALALSHVELSLSQLPLLDRANQRVRQLCARFGLPVASALPVLLTRPDAPRAQMVLHGWSRLPLQTWAHGLEEPCSRATQALRQRSRERTAPLFAMLDPATAARS